MTATLLSINAYYGPRGGAESVFFRHNGMLHDGARTPQRNRQTSNPQSARDRPDPT